MSLVSVVREGHSEIKFLMSVSFQRFVYIPLISLSDARYDLLAYKGGSAGKALD